jgi:hypothetical protein
MNNITKTLEVLNEMSPQNISPLDHNRYESASNTYFNQNKSKFKTTNTEYLYKSGDNNNGYYMLVVDNYVEYFVKYESKSYQSLLAGRMIKQLLVQRNLFSSYSAQIPKIVFFEYLLPTFGTIITDTKQTPDGKKFWVNAVMDALKDPSKYSVYVLNKNKGETTEITSPKEFHQSTNKIWGDDNCFQHVLLAISLKQRGI